MNEKFFQRKRILVTGAAGGIGRNIVQSLSEKGAFVYATDRNLDSLKDLSQLPGVRIHSLDVRRESSWNSVISKLEFPLDGLIQSAGVLKPGYVSELDPKDIDFHFDINVKGLILGSVLVAKLMKKQKSGHIVNIASLAGLAPIPGLSLYSSSKFAVRAFTLAMALEMKKYNVSVTVLCPDAVKTPMLSAQAGYEEAALTFSGQQLEPEQVTREVLRSFSDKRLEIVIPLYRGILGKWGNLFPGFSSLILGILTKKGLKRQKDFQHNEKGELW